PLLARSPAMKAAGGTTRALVEFVDIYPSLCQLCGLDTPPHCEGSSFVPLMDAPATPWKKAALSQYPRTAVMAYAMRTDRYRYIEGLDKQTKACRARELYDHEHDAREDANIAEQADADLLAALAAQLHASWPAAKP